MFDANVAYFTFVGDDNKELKRIQEFLFIAEHLERHVVNSCKDSLIHSCEVINLKESKTILELAKDSEYYDHRCFHQFNSIISAIYRFEFGTNQLRINLDPLTDYQKSIYYGYENSYGASMFKLCFEKEPIQWYHFTEFKIYYIKKVNYLIQFPTFVHSIIYNTIYRTNNLGKDHFIDEKVIRNSVLEIFDLGLEDGVLDFSNFESANYT